eukprot:351357-Chlamydomonas_euryale.AAC.3
MPATPSGGQGCRSRVPPRRLGGRGCRSHVPPQVGAHSDGDQHPRTMCIHKLVERTCTLWCAYRRRPKTNNLA